MNRTQLEALTDLLKAVEEAEQDAGMFFNGKVDLVNADQKKLAELDLLGSREHTLTVSL